MSNRLSERHAKQDAPHPGSVPIRSLVAAGLGAAVTAIFALDLVDVSYRNAAAHLVLETAQGCVALLVAFLLYGRYSRSRRLQDLLLLQGLALLAFAGVVLDGVVPAFDGAQGGMTDVWLPLIVRSCGVACIAAAALAGPGRVTSRTWGPVDLGPAIAVVVAATAALWWQSVAERPALEPFVGPDSGSERLTEGHPLLITAMVFSAICFGLSAVVFTLQARSQRDELVAWLGPACTLAMFARVNYILFPSLYSDWLHVGDLLRVGFYLLLLVGAGREISEYWAAQARAAVFEDRRRVARELHDGVLQELGYIRAESREFLGTDPVRTERVLGACDRALDETRQAVEALGHTGEEPLGYALHRAARQVTERHRLGLELDVDDSIFTGQQERHALLRIVREAISNAARHGGAEHIRIQLTEGDTGRVLTVADDGSGFDVGTALSRRTGFGLTSMRERAQGLSGWVEIESKPGAGSTVTVRW